MAALETANLLDEAQFLSVRCTEQQREALMMKESQLDADQRALKAKQHDRQLRLRDEQSKQVSVQSRSE